MPQSFSLIGQRNMVYALLYKLEHKTCFGDYCFKKGNKMKNLTLVVMCLLFAGCATVPSPLVGTWRNEDVKYRMVLRDNGTFRAGNPAQSKTGRWKMKNNNLTLFVEKINTYIGSSTMKAPYKQILNVVELKDQTMTLRASSGRVFTVTRTP